jgi:excisionase family DNA binding protein
MAGRTRHTRDRKAKVDQRSRGWDDWQRYVRKETQRLMQKSGRNVVEVSFAEPERAQAPPEEKPAGVVEMAVPEPYEGRRPPVPGVPREEALELKNDEIGRTVRPFTVDDYRNIRPLTSSDLFDTEERAVAETATASPSVDKPPVRPVAEAPIADAATVPEIPEDPARPVAESPPKRRGRKKKGAKDGELELFGSVSEHQTISRQRLTRKNKFEREELIEKLLDPVISLEEAATLIGVCKTTVRRYTNKGELECLRTPGQQRRFKLSQVLAFVKKREEEQKARRRMEAKGK